LVEFIHLKGLKTGDMQWLTTLICLTISDCHFCYFLSLSQYISLSFATLCRLTPTVYNSYILHGRVAQRNQSPSVSLSYLLDVEMTKSRQRLNGTDVPTQSQPGSHF